MDAEPAPAAAAEPLLGQGGAAQQQPEVEPQAPAVSAPYSAPSGSAAPSEGRAPSGRSRGRPPRVRSRQQLSPSPDPLADDDVPSRGGWAAVGL